MQVTTIMLIALSGLGCHHKICGANQAPANCFTAACWDSRFAIEYATIVEPSCYNPCYSGCCGAGDNCLPIGCARDGWGPVSGGYVGCYAGGAVGCGSSRFPPHGFP